MRNDPDGGLRNSLYEQQTRSARRLTRARRLLHAIAVPVGLALVRLVWRWCRVVSVEGREHLAAALARTPSFIPVYWHQQQVFCVKLLLEQRAAGLKLGFLISPSVDGEIGARVVRALDAAVIRGSSSYTGARALRDYYQALVQDGVSPAITPDGPRGPKFRFKPGAILLSQLSQRPIVPMAYAASRAWRIQWDEFLIPMPLARVAIAVGEPVVVPKGLGQADLERWQDDLGARLDALAAAAATALRKTGKAS